uniref:FCP1 homology domain-containing protein n=1 Tax=Peronospora matthiolae TaxID=2874970 RepID=A0AAV1TGF9_9STRA
MAEVNAVHDASRKRKRRKNRKNKQQPLLQGHYVDPRSPIASTPMKRQRTKAAETNTSQQAPPPSDASNLDGAKFKEKEKLFSPRKLLAEYDEAYEEKQPGAVKARTKLNYDLVTVSDDELEQKHVKEGEPDGSKDGLFSPALKPPRTSRSTSASPPRAQGRLDVKLRLESVQPDDQAEHSVVLATEVFDADVVNEEEHEEEDGTMMEHEFNPFYFMKTLPKYEDITEGKRPVSLPERSRNAPKICLVLDLDETLVHCSVDEVKDPHMQFPVTFNGVEYTVNVKKRPHMEYFLKCASKLFEIVVFTASHQVYAEKLMNMLDPHRNLIKYRLYRDDCLDVFGNYLKDLNVLGRDLSKVVLVDNSPHAFGYQVNNGVPIETWYDDEADAELLNLLPFLESLVDVDDVRPIVEQQFQIQKLIDATPDGIS